MSTKAIREVYEELRAGRMPTHAQGAAMLAEVDAIEKAARVLEAEGVGDAVYTVRDRAAGDSTFTGNTWEHPRIVAYGEAAQVISNIARESAGRPKVDAGPE